MSETTDHDAKVPQGAILTDDQIKRLKVAIAVMSALLVIGIVTLIARVIYLASGRNEAATANLAAPTAGAPLLAEVRIALPAGAALKSSSLNGNRFIAHYSSSRGDGLLILDLATGKTLSHVRIEAAP